MIQEKLTETIYDLLKWANPNLEIEEVWDFEGRVESYHFERNLSEYISITMQVPTSYGETVHINLFTSIEKLTPEKIRQAMNELICYRDQLQKKGYSGNYSDDVLGDGYVEYTYNPLIQQESDLTKIIQDFNLTKEQ